MGWKINLPEAGERVVVDAFALEGLIYFNTMTPSSSPCSTGGSSWLMSVDQKTGGTPNIVSFDFNGDKILSPADTYAAGLKFDYGIASKTSILKTNNGITYGYTSGTDNSVNAGSSVPSISKQILPGSIAPATGERQSWIQLFNE
jgi:type IV pilus assembly protein PilY1